jgi:hypothetical protein
MVAPSIVNAAPPVQAEPAFEAAAPEAPVAVTEDIREEVSRIVAETRAAIETPVEPRPRLEQETVGMPFWPGPKKAEPEEKKDFVEDYGMDSTSEASWPIAKASAEKPAPPGIGRRVEAPLPVEEPVEAIEAAASDVAGENDDDDEARREEVARVVAQMRDGGDEEDVAEADEAPAEEVEKKHLDVAKMVADLRNSVDVEAESFEEGEPSANGDDEDARREEVDQVVAEMRNGDVEASEEEGDGAGDESKREDVASMVARMRAEMDGDSRDEEADGEVRDEVRRAVEAARAEMASGYKEATEETGEKKFSFPDWRTTHMEPSGPPVIVIKDSEGRVELARVYETLSKVDCDENAALLNYTPHSVTVGLNTKASVPGVEALTEAVKLVFGRACEVDSDGVRVNVQIGKDLKGKDSAA